MISQHQTADSVCHRDVRTPLGQSDLNTRRTPWNEGGQATLADAEETLVHIGGIDLSLDYVEDGNIAALLARHRRYHAVLWLQQPPHDVQDCRFAHRLGLLDLVAGERGVGSHEEVAAWCGDQRGENADEVVVHVARVSEGGSARGHDGRHELVGLVERRLLDV